MNKTMSWMTWTMSMLALSAGFALAVTGTTNAPAAPSSAGSAMWTLNDIYNVLNTRTTNVAQRTGGFAEPSAGPTNGNMYTLNDIMTLVTKMSPVPKTGQTPTLPFVAKTGGDGTLRFGVAWPNPRFSALPAGATGQETNQIRDNLTGLIWARNANFAGGTLNWTNALNYVAATNASPTGYGGTNDWRMPNARELYSLIAFQYKNGRIPVSVTWRFESALPVRRQAVTPACGVTVTPPARVRSLPQRGL